MSDQINEEDLSFTEYQVITASTAIYPGQGTSLGLSYVTLGLVGEAGEIANKVKKVLRDDGGIVSEEKREAVLAELGDVLWYLARLADELDSSLEQSASENISKLLDRQTRGVLGGSGDTR
jgi:NTP pyrophosphatase (non-canonical NTP hydrolase)